MDDWTHTCYSRLLIDNHITEDDPSFMTHFSPQTYVSLVKKAGVEASMVYTCDHNGNCYYPTRVGHQHANLKGRDIFGETTRLLRQEGIHPIAYYTTIFHNDSAKKHPSWRMQDMAGHQHERRYWWSCPNNPDYVDFTKKQLDEIIAYDIDGIFIDMTFWPVVCTCPNCRQKFLLRSGHEIPTKLDWSDPLWVDFQHFREESMVTFCQVMRHEIKSKKEMTITFQNSPIIYGWSWGQTRGIADACDYTSGDFYGGKHQHLLGAKILSAASRNQPYEYMTSRCINLNDHTSMKSEAEMICEAATTLANGGAYFFIDAINPDGSLNPQVYERMGKVSKTLAPVTQKVKETTATLKADTGLYFSMPSYIDPSMNGKPLRDLEKAFDGPYTSTLAYEEMLGTSIILTHAHRPYRVVREAEGNLDDLNTIIINHAVVMSPDEVEKIRTFVRQGGTLIATGLTSLMRPDDYNQSDFALADVFGVSFTGNYSRRIHYLKQEGQELVSCHRPAVLVKPAEGTQVLAELLEPLFDPDDPTHYASIHSNPPGRSTGCPALTVHNYGAGRCIYLASPVLSTQLEAQEAFGVQLLKQLAPEPMVETNAPSAMELTVLHESQSNDLLVGLVNYQTELPNIPARDIHIAIRLTDGGPIACRSVMNQKELPFTWEKDVLRITLPYVETIEMIEIIRH